MHLTASIIPKDFKYVPFREPPSAAQCQILEFLDDVACRVGLPAYLKMIQQSIASNGDGWRNELDYVEDPSSPKGQKEAERIEDIAKAIEGIADMMDNLINAIPEEC